MFASTSQDGPHRGLTIGMGRAKVKIGMANIAYNMLRYVWLMGKPRAA